MKIQKKKKHKIKFVMWELRDGHSDSDRLLKYYIDEICS